MLSSTVLRTAFAIAPRGGGVPRAPSSKVPAWSAFLSHTTTICFGVRVSSIAFRRRGRLFIGISLLHLPEVECLGLCPCSAGHSRFQMSPIGLRSFRSLEPSEEHLPGNPSHWPRADRVALGEVD